VAAVVAPPAARAASGSAAPSVRDQDMHRVAPAPAPKTPAPAPGPPPSSPDGRRAGTSASTGGPASGGGSVDAVWPLHAAAARGDASGFKALLARGYIPTGADGGGWSVVARSWASGNVEMLRAAVQACARAGSALGPAFHVALGLSPDAAADGWAAGHTQVAGRQDLCLTPLHFAAICGNQAYLANLPAGVDVDVVTLNGMTPLTDAVRNGHAHVVDTLLRQGAKPSASTLMLAVQHRHTAVVHYLVQGGRVNVDEAKFGWRALHVAAHTGQAAVVDLLLNAGADASAMTSDGETPLMLAANAGHARIVTALMPRCSPHTQRAQWARGDKLTALHAAAKRGHTAVVRAWIAGGGDVGLRLPDGTTAAQTALGAGHIAILDMLVDAGCPDPLPKPDFSSWASQLRDNLSDPAGLIAAARRLPCGVPSTAAAAARVTGARAFAPAAATPAAGASELDIGAVLRASSLQAADSRPAALSAAVLCMARDLALLMGTGRPGRLYLAREREQRRDGVGRTAIKVGLTSEDPVDGRFQRVTDNPSGVEVLEHTGGVGTAAGAALRLSPSVLVAMEAQFHVKLAARRVRHAGWAGGGRAGGGA